VEHHYSNTANHQALTVLRQWIQDRRNDTSKKYKNKHDKQRWSVSPQTSTNTNNVQQKGTIPQAEGAWMLSGFTHPTHTTTA